MLINSTYRLTLFTAIVALAMSHNASAQLMPDWDARRNGVDGFSFGYNVPVHLVTDSQGAVYVTASTDDNPTTDILTMKYTPDGTVVWAVTYDGPSGFSDSGVAITIDGAGDILVLGRSECDFLVIKYDASDGSVIWTNQHDGGNCPERPKAFTTDAAGNVYVTGSTRPPGGDHQEDFYTYKLDSAGNVLWTATYDGPGPFLNGSDIAVDIALDSNGNVFVTGPSVNAFGQMNFVTIKYHPTDGAQMWLARLDVSGLKSVALLISPEDDVYVTGSEVNGHPPFVTVKHDGHNGSQMWVSVNLEAYIYGKALGMAFDSQGDVYVTGRLDPDGNQSNINENVVTMRLRASDGVREWLSIFGGSQNNQFELGLAIAIDAEDNVFVTGRTSSFGAANDLLLLQYDAASGQIVDQGTFDVPTEDPQGQAMWLDSAQNLIVAGTTRADPSGFMDILILKYPSQVTSVSGDLDGDGVVNTSDLLILFSNWGQCPVKGDCPADLDGDGVVNTNDLLILFANWG